jgi:uncharacterized phage protein gp47/JayE
VTFAPRLYPDIVRDLLTTLSGGTVREQVIAPTDGPIVLDRLADRPVRRVSHLEGITPAGAAAEPVRVRFTDADFELVDTTGEGTYDAIAFRDTGRKPVPGSPLTVNYYPVETRPVPLTDLNVGSVVRTLLETVAREVALEEQYLDRIYRSAFLETAEGSSLDRVVALIGVTRLPAGHPLVRIRFSRNAAAGGQITVPAGTVVTDADANRYLTTTRLVLEPGETSREVLASGATPDTPTVAAGALDRLEVLVAGVSSATNPEPAHRPSSPESDDELRRRSRGALHGAVRGTLDALRFGVRSVPGVKDVSLVEFPNGVAGEVRIDVAYVNADDAEAEAAVARRIRELRPAGIRVIGAQAARRTVHVNVRVVLAGVGVTGAELDAVTRGVEERIAAKLGDVPPGGTVRANGLVAAALEDSRVVDVEIGFTDPSGVSLAPLALSPGEVLDLVRPFAFDPPQAEEESDALVATTAHVDAYLPVIPEVGVTMAEIEEAISLALRSHLASRGPSAPLSVDAIAAAIRDDTRFALDRERTTVTVEHQGRFLQLVDRAGSHQPGPAETIRLRSLDVMEASR